MPLRLFGSLVSKCKSHSPRAVARKRCQPRRRPQLRYFRILSQGQHSWPDCALSIGKRKGRKQARAWAVFVHRSLYSICATLMLMSPLAAFAQTSNSNGSKNLSLLQGDTLNEAFNGRTMDGTYKAIRDRTGTSNFTETFFKNGATDYREGKLRERGRWQLSGPPGFENVICFTYQGTMAGPPSCFTVFRDGTCLYSYGPHMVKDGNPLDPNFWQAKTIIRGELSSCDDMVT